MAFPAAIAAFTTFEPLVLPLVQDLINHFHKTTPPDPANDPKKLQAVADTTFTALQGHVATGSLQGLPTIQDVLLFVQKVFTSMKSDGTLATPFGSLKPMPTVTEPVPAPAMESTSKGLDIPISFTGKLTISL